MPASEVSCSLTVGVITVANTRMLASSQSPSRSWRLNRVRRLTKVGTIPRIARSGLRRPRTRWTVRSTSLRPRIANPDICTGMSTSPAAASALMVWKPKLGAEPGAQVALGLKPGVTLDGVKAGIETGTLESSLNLLDAARGEMVFVDAGTVHAILPGAILLETQQNCDLTYRM